MNRLIALVVALLVLAGVLIVFTLPAPNRSGSEPRAVEPAAWRQREAAAAEPDNLRTGVRVREEPASAPDVSRVSVEERAPATTAVESFEILVKERGGGAVAGAKLLVLAGELADHDALNDYERVDAFMAEHAQALTADTEGRVRIAPPGVAGAYLVASAPGLWGGAQLDAEAESPFTLELARDRPLIARVVEEGGRPVAGARVELRRKHDTWSWVTHRREAGEDGQVEFRHAQEYVKLEGETGIVLRADVLSVRPIEQTLDPEALPQDVVTLVVPAMGSVSARVRESDGSTPTGSVSAALGIVAPGQPRTLSPFGSERRETVEATVVDGAARFEFVALGQELELSAEREGARVATKVYGFGPTRPGEERAFDVVLGAGHPTIRLRALDSSGSAIATAQLALRLDIRAQYINDWNDMSVTTDADGRFLLDLDPGWDEDGSRILTVTKPNPDGEAPSGTVDLGREFPEGISDLGDVTLGAAPVFARGKVVDTAGAAVADAQLLLRARTEEGFGLVWDFDHKTDAEGRFDVRGKRPGDAFEIGAAKSGLAGQLQSFQPGAEDLVIVLQGEGAIAGRVLLDERVPLDKVSLHLEGDEELLQHLQYYEREASPSEDGTFRLAQLLPGTYDVYLQLDDSSERLVDVQGIAVTAGATSSDPRLEIDLRGVLFVHAIRFESPDGTEGLQGEISFDRAGSGELAYTTYFREPVVNLVSTLEAIDVFAAARGYRVERVDGVRGATTIHLRKGLPVRIVLRSSATLPEPPVFIKAVLAPADSPYRGIDWGAPTFDETREILVRAPSPGKMQVHWVVERRTSGSSVATAPELPPLQFVEVRDVDVEQRIEVTLTEEQMAQLVGAL